VRRIRRCAEMRLALQRAGQWTARAGSAIGRAGTAMTSELGRVLITQALAECPLLGEAEGDRQATPLKSVEFDPNGTFVTVRDPAFTGLRWAGQRKVAD
jgi:hypothetical protein